MNDLRRTTHNEPFVVLVRTFFAQFYASESVSSEMRLRESMVFVLAFVITPCVFLIVSVFPQYTRLTLPVPRRLAIGTIIRWGEVRHRMGDDMLEWLTAVLVGYAMVAAGLVAVFVWDSLTFDRRDAMVLGPLPLRGSTLILAKVTALALFLLGAAVGLNLLNASVFAAALSLRLTQIPGNFVSILLVTTAAAMFVFALIVAVRSIVALAAGPRFSAGLGSVLQFAFVAALLVFLVSVVAPPARPGLLRIPDTLSPPVTWFVAAFEVIRRSARGSWDGFIAESRYAFAGVPLALAVALAASVAAHRRQMQLALTSAAASDFRRARISRAIGRVCAGRDALARAVVDFILTTIARSPVQRLPIAINAAVGLGVMVVALSRTQGDATGTLMALPLMAAFWLSIGLRASFFVPSQLPAAWTWFVNAPDRLTSYRAGARASIVALVAPVTTLVAIAVGGWPHGVVTAAFVVAFAAFVAWSIDFIPFTRPDRPGHARLRRRWPLYLVSAFGLPYGIVAIELRIGADPAGTALSAALLVGVAAGFDILGRFMPRSWHIGAPDEQPDDDVNRTIVLDLAAPENRRHRSAEQNAVTGF